MSYANHEYFMQAAIHEAVLAYEAGEVPVGAVVVCSGRIIARGRNQMIQLGDPTAHAEMIALTSACSGLGSRYLSDCVLYVTLEPCPMCAAASHWAQLGGIVFGAADPRRGFERFEPSLLHPKTTLVRGVLAHKCSEVLETFFWKLRG